ncbi:MAG: helix-turn-helix transcriptional regulator [Oscillospiraceae bacterium]|nr:helix-turn-helix transcriptional regulator [Oscillospiraceae bacterium]
MTQILFGILIKRERIRRNWSQSGLCKGICAVSYLSKIEQGKAGASPEVLALLMERLSIPWRDDPADAARIERGYEAVFSGEQMDGLLPELDACAAVPGPYLPDALLLRAWFRDQQDPAASEYESCFDLRRRTLYLLLEERHEDALLLNPIPLCYLAAGNAEYQAGRCTAAVEYLRQCYDLSAQSGLLPMMLHSRILLGNCYSNLLDYPHMAEHYRVASRIAAALGNEELARAIVYNTAATQLELGRTEDAYQGLSSLRDPSAMALHKLAICCEKLGRTEEALNALDQAEAKTDDYPDQAITREFCALVRFRLKKPNYLHDPAYGEALLCCFQNIRKTMPIGYASFHLPWVLEWYKANRQYKQACELLETFPIKLPVTSV